MHLSAHHGGSAHHGARSSSQALHPSIHSAHHGARSSSQALHSVHSVLLCKNRRSALRARQAGSLSCAVELPPRPDENRWIYAWSSQVINGLLMAC